MNRVNCNVRWRGFSLSPSEGKRVGVRGPFSPLGSGSHCMRKSETGLPMENEKCATRPPAPPERGTPPSGGSNPRANGPSHTSPGRSQRSPGIRPQKNTPALKARLIKNCDPQPPTWNNASHEPCQLRRALPIPLPRPFGRGEGRGEGSVRSSRFMVPTHARKRNWALSP